jgi:hypothetical protein
MDLTSGWSSISQQMANTYGVGGTQSFAGIAQATATSGDPSMQADANQWLGAHSIAPTGQAGVPYSDTASTSSLKDFVAKLLPDWNNPSSFSNNPSINSNMGGSGDLNQSSCIVCNQVSGFLQKYSTAALGMVLGIILFIGAIYVYGRK